MSKAIGIDLGTTNSVGAFSEAKVEVVSNDSNSPPDRKLTRSIVADIQGQLVVGEVAYNQLRNDPENVVVSIKRLIGRGFSDEKVQQQKAKFDYKIDKPTDGTDNAIAVWIGGKEYQPEDISAEILKKVVQNAKEYRKSIGKGDETINQAVITIPAYFNDKQKQATRTAAYKAGITPLELLPEPTAAAISYGYSPNTEDVKTILVYDFGGGTFDVSLITAAGTEFIESGKAGDLWLGGDNVDDQILDFVKAQVAKEENLKDIDSLIEKMPRYQKIQLKAELKIACERAKIELSSLDVARIEPATQLLDEMSFAIPIEVELTREKFESIIMPLVNRTIEICHEALSLSEYTPDLVDVVLLVGGSSQIPLVQRKVKEAFGADKVVIHPRPMYAVAEGAAIVAAGKVSKIGSVSRDYCIKLSGNPRHEVIRRGELLPVLKSETYKSIADGQRLIHLEFFSPDKVAEDLDNKKNDERIGDMWLPLDSDYPKGTEIEVYYELDDKENALKVRANLKNDPSVKVEASFSRGKSNEEIYKDTESFIAEMNEMGLSEAGVKEATIRLAAVVRDANGVVDVRTGQERTDVRDRAKAEIKQIKSEFDESRLDAESYIGEIGLLLNICEYCIPKPQQERLTKIKLTLESSIKSENQSKMQAAVEDAKQEIKLLPDKANAVILSIYAIRKANQVNPAVGRAMGIKLDNFINADKQNNTSEAARLWNELFPDIQRYLGETSTSTGIATGISR